MARFSWTTPWTTNTDDGGTKALTAQDIADFQDNCNTVVDSLADENFHEQAGIVESKVSFDASTGHNHDGTDSRLIRTIAREYRSGCQVKVTGDGQIIVRAGQIDLNGTLRNLTTDTTLDLSTTTNWITDTEESSSEQVYVYAYDNAGTLTYKLSDDAPNALGTDDVYRYRVYSGTTYRCVGGAFTDADSNLLPGTQTSFDASNIMSGMLVGTAADITVRTIWTPTFVRVWYATTDPALSAGVIFQWEAFRRQLTTYALPFVHTADAHDWEAVTTSSAIESITAQVAGTAGGFTLDSFATTTRLFFMAVTKGFNTAAT